MRAKCCTSRNRRSAMRWCGLRRAFGDPLFIRSGRGMTPTPEAEQLIGPVRDAMARLRSGLDRGAGFRSARRPNARSTWRRAMSQRLRSRRRSRAPGDEGAARALLLPSDRPRGGADRTRCAACSTSPSTSPALAQAGSRKPAVHRRSVRVRVATRSPAGRGVLTMSGCCALNHVAVSRRRGGRTVVDLALNQTGRTAAAGDALSALCRGVPRRRRRPTSR